MTKATDSIREMMLGLFKCGIIDRETVEDIVKERNPLLERIKSVREKYIPTCHTTLEAEMLQLIADLQDRLELGYGYQGDKRVEIDFPLDGIDCRNITIEEMQSDMNEMAKVEKKVVSALRRAIEIVDRYGSFTRNSDTYKMLVRALKAARYEQKPFGDVKIGEIVEDFLPSPEELVRKE